MRIYADTSVFGGVFDVEFESPSKRFFEEIEAGKFTLVTSAIVAAEIEPAPKDIRSFFEKYSKIAEVAIPDEKTFHLQNEYIKSGVVNKDSDADALHVALATISKCDIIVSWNFRHIVHFDKIPKFNAVNVLNGYQEIGIYSPMEVIGYDYS